MRKRFFSFLSAVIILSACNSSNTNDVSQDLTIPDSVKNGKPLQISEEVMENMIQNISSPVEIASLIRSTGMPYSQKYICKTDDIEKYDSNFKRAIGLGILGADLGYLNMYNKTGSVLGNLSTIKSIADELKIGQFFDFSTLKRLSVNNENLDSLIFISTQSFNNMDSYLRESDRTSISALIVTGLWIEGLYIASQVVKENKHKDLAERIGDQKIIINDLLIILRNYKSDPNFASLIADIEAVKERYADIKISYIKGEPEAVEKDGMLVIVQNETSVVEMTDQQLADIISITEATRSKLISL
ncbi:MAG: hypothetical protein A2033_06975 [Bacteroidetes bacterium GWA2_31_9]|nr:MAG: hypothetical protein A2033_06975 [Bacteroidetes bacterium GWA2_31_9]